MATVHDVLTRAFRAVGILSAGETLGAEDAAAGLASFNGLVAGWELQGIRMALDPLALTDEIPLPDGHVEAVLWNLCLQLCAEYNRQVPPAVVALANTGKRGLQAAYAAVPEMRGETMWLSRRRFLAR